MRWVETTCTRHQRLSQRNSHLRIVGKFTRRPIECTTTSHFTGTSKHWLGKRLKVFTSRTKLKRCTECIANSSAK